MYDYTRMLKFEKFGFDVNSQATACAKQSWTGHRAYWAKSWGAAS